MKKRNKILALTLVMMMIISSVAGCGSKGSSKDGSGDNNATNQPTQSATDDKGSGSDEQITLRMIDWSDSVSTIRKAFNEEYMKNNPNIKIEYTMMTQDQFKSSVITAIKSGDAPDLFPVPGGMSLYAAVQENWYQPMDSLFPADFWDTLDDAVLGEGSAKVNGSYYSIPETAPITDTLIYYNQDVLDAAGVTEIPKTYSEFLDACKKVTKAGKGQYYGFIEGGKQLNRLFTLATAFSNVAGAQLPQMSRALTVNGRVNYDSDAVLGTFALFKQLYDDGSIHPDTVNLDAPSAREYFAQGQAAFIMQGNWCVSTWDENYPDMNYGVMAVPAPDSGAKGGVSNSESAPWVGIYSQSKHPQEAADYLKALYNYTEGYTYQKDMVATAGQLSIVKGMVEENLSNPHALAYYKLANEVTKIIPSAAVRDPKVYDMYAEVVDVQPSLAALFQGILSGSLDDYKSALTTLSDATTAEWKRAADKVGVDFSELEFSDWNPAESYVQQ